MDNLLPIVAPTSCESCGICCHGIGSPIVLYASHSYYGDPHPFRPTDLPQSLIAEIDFHFSGLLRGQEPQDFCLWFDRDTGLCKHHEYRPQVCRDYEMGGRECLRERRAFIQAGNTLPIPRK